MNKAEFEFVDETADPGDAGQPAGGLYADAARGILREGVVKLMDQALEWHRRDAEERAWWEAYRVRMEQRSDETLHEWFGRKWKEMWSADANAPKAPPAPHSAIKITTGGSKSTILRDVAALRYVPAAKREALPHRVLIAVPTHELAYEADRKMPAGITTAIYQGLKAFKLGTDKEPMCRNHPAIDAALQLGADVQQTACRKGQRGGPDLECPFLRECHYQAMLQDCAAADIVFVAHELLFKLPAALGEFGLVIADESFWQKGLFGANENDPVRLCIGGLAEELKDFPVTEKQEDGPRAYSARRTEELRNFLSCLQTALEGESDGYVRREALVKGKLPSGANIYRYIRGLEWARKVDHGLRPGATAEELEAAVKQYGFLAQIKRRVEMWRAIGELMGGSEEASGHLSIAPGEPTAEGTVRYLEISGRKRIDKKLIRLPIICADATLQIELTRYYLPRLELTIDLKVYAPHMRTVQVTEMAVGKSSLQRLTSGKRTPEKEAEVAGKRKRLAALCRELVAGRRGLVITYLAIEDDFRGLRHRNGGADNVEVAHFGAIEGIDRWSDVDVAVIIGRPLLWKDDAARLAAAITGKPVVTDTVREVRLVGDRNSGAGVNGVKVRCWVCTDPDAELIRVGITEAAVEQAHGRVRGINRTGSNPVEVYMVLGDVVVPGLEVDEVVKFQKIEPGPVEEMIARGWWLESPKDAHRLFPGLFVTPEAAKKAYQRLRSNVHRGTSLYKYIFIKACPPVLDIQLRYGRRGMRQRPWLASVDPSKVPDPRAVLEAAFGEELALFEMLEPGAEAKPKRKQRKRKPKAAPAPNQPTPPVEPVTVLDRPYLVQEDGRILLRWW